jgi:hypothetical protein
MIRAIAKTRYLRGRGAVGKAKAHIRYIEHRPGEDREHGRDFFNEEGEGINRQQIYQELEKQDERGVICHKLILSPGVENADLKAYTKEMMGKLGADKGLELSWYAVEHRNTEHPHAHVVIMGMTENGQRVRIDKGDLKFLRDQGDRYLEREHVFERYINYEMVRLFREPTRAIELKYERSRGDKEFERLFGEPDEKRRRGYEAERDRREWELFDKELHRQFDTPDRGLERSKGYKQWNIEQSGRLSEFHERSTAREAKERLGERLGSEDAQIAEAAAKQLAEIERLESERMGQYKGLDIDRLIDGKDRELREMDRLIDREFADLDREMKEFWGSKGQDERLKGVNPIDMFAPGTKDQERDREDERTFEIDRQHGAFRERLDEDERDDRDRDDDMFER